MNKLLMFLRRLAGPAYPPFDRLVQCSSCGADLMNPVRWHDVDALTWWIRLRCGACGAVREVEASNAEARQLEADLDLGLARIAAAVVELDRGEMAVAADALVSALERDLIDPDDFRR
jgi:hypothetical protein